MPPIEERKAGIPESITINGVTYAVKDTPELQQFIQEVAKVEKSKLYTQFENLKSQIANLGKVKVVSDEKQDVDAIVEKLKGTFVTKEDFQTMLPDVIKEVVQPVLTATEQNRQNELAQYRERIINENIATCIPELVTGDTKEQLDAALKESIRIRSSYPTPSTAHIDPNKPVVDPVIQKQAREAEVAPTFIPPTPSAASPASPVIPTQVTVPTPPAAPKRPSLEVGAAQGVKSMTMEEFAKQRENLRAQLETAYGGSLY